MNSAFKKIVMALDCLAEKSGHVLAWLTLAMVIVTAINVLGSWLFNRSWIGLTESVTWMHSANFLLAAGYTLNRNEQVRVDIFYQSMGLRAKAWVDLSGTLLLLLPICGFIFWSSWSYVLLSWQTQEVSAEPGGLAAVYVLKSLLLLMPIMLSLEGINQILKNINHLANCGEDTQALDANTNAKTDVKPNIKASRKSEEAN